MEILIFSWEKIWQMMNHPDHKRNKRYNGEIGDIIFYKIKYLPNYVLVIEDQLQKLNSIKF